jgi:hypothetical protein
MIKTTTTTKTTTKKQTNKHKTPTTLRFFDIMGLKIFFPDKCTI